MLPPTTDGRVLSRRPQAEQAERLKWETVPRRGVHILSLIREFHRLECTAAGNFCVLSILFCKNTHTHTHSTVSCNCV